MSRFWGIIVDESLKDKSLTNDLDVIATRQVGSWNLLLLSFADDELDEKISLLQQTMVDAQEGHWYAHFFRDDELIVVYQDRAYRMTVDRESWAEALQHGLDLGIPMEQLDFNPRTEGDAARNFGLTNG